jgi:hypothetical protein
MIGCIPWPCSCPRRRGPYSPLSSAGTRPIRRALLVSWFISHFAKWRRECSAGIQKQSALFGWHRAGRSVKERAFGNRRLSGLGRKSAVPVSGLADFCENVRGWLGEGLYAAFLAIYLSSAHTRLGLGAAAPPAQKSHYPACPISDKEMDGSSAQKPSRQSSGV